MTHSNMTQRFYWPQHPDPFTGNTLKLTWPVIRKSKVNFIMFIQGFSSALVFVSILHIVFLADVTIRDCTDTTHVQGLSLKF